MKKVGSLLFMLLFMFTFPLIGQAAGGGTSIILDGKTLNLPENGQIQNLKGHIMIPIRVVMEELDFDVNWDKKTRTVTIKQADTTVQLVINQKTAIVNGNKTSIAAAPILHKDTTLVPVRFISEQMGMTVDWDNSSKTVYLLSPKSSEQLGNGSGSGNDSNSSSDLPADSDQQDNLASVLGISFVSNKLMIAVDKQVSPNVFKLTNPDRIVVDIPHTKFSDTFGSNHVMDQYSNGFIDVTEYPDVSKVRYSLFNSNPSTVRVVLDTNGTKNYQLTQEADGLVVIDLNVNQSSPVKNGKPLVVIDAGHGGSDPGAIGVTGKKEKDFNLSVVLKIENLLKKETSIDYVLTRATDTYVKLQDRAKLANDLNADLFVSVHANAGSSTASGVETYYTRPESLDFANVMHKHLVKSSGLPDRKVRTKSLHVTRETKMPAVLLEFGYLSNKNDEAVLFTEKFQNNVAKGVVDGIKEYLGLN